MYNDSMTDTRDQLQISQDFLASRKWTVKILDEHQLSWNGVGVSGDCYNFMPITYLFGKVNVPMQLVRDRDEQAVIGFIIVSQIMAS